MKSRIIHRSDAEFVAKPFFEHLRSFVAGSSFWIDEIMAYVLDVSPHAMALPMILFAFHLQPVELIPIRHPGRLPLRRSPYCCGQRAERSGEAVSGD